jgi:hypothetical protein
VAAAANFFIVATLQIGNHSCSVAPHDAIVVVAYIGATLQLFRKVGTFLLSILKSASIGSVEPTDAITTIA